MAYVIECAFTYGWDILNKAVAARSRIDDVYPTQAAAQEAINDLIADTKKAFRKGDMDEPYDPEDFRVVERHET